MLLLTFIIHPIINFIWIQDSGTAALAETQTSISPDASSTGLTWALLFLWILMIN